MSPKEQPVTENMMMSHDPRTRVSASRKKKREEIDSSENENGNKLKLNLWNLELIIQLPAQAAAMPIFKS